MLELPSDSRRDNSTLKAMEIIGSMYLVVELYHQKLDGKARELKICYCPEKL